MKKLNCAVERAQGTAGVNWDSVSMELGRCVAHVKQKWRRIKLASGKASRGYHQAHFSQLHHCRQNKCPELVDWFNDHLHSPYPGTEEEVNPRRRIVTNSNMGFADPPLGVREPQKTPQTIEKRPQYLHNP